MPGRGVSGESRRDGVALGSPAFLADAGVSIDAAIARVEAAAQTIVGVADDATLVGWITLADALRPEAAAAVATLATPASP